MQKQAASSSQSPSWFSSISSYFAPSAPASAAPATQASTAASSTSAPSPPLPPPLPLDDVYTEPCAWVFGGELLGRLTGGQVPPLFYYFVHGNSHLTACHFDFTMQCTDNLICVRIFQLCNQHKQKMHSTQLPGVLHFVDEQFNGTPRYSSPFFLRAHPSARLPVWPPLSPASSQTPAPSTTPPPPSPLSPPSSMADGGAQAISPQSVSQLALDDDRALMRACCSYSVRSTKPGSAPANNDTDTLHSQTASPVQRHDPCAKDAGEELPYVFQFTEAVAQRRRPWGAPAGNSDY